MINQPLRFLLLTAAGWMNRKQQDVPSTDKSDKRGAMKSVLMFTVMLSLVASAAEAPAEEGLKFPVNFGPGPGG